MKKFLFLFLILCGCSQNQDLKRLKVMATPVPQAEILNFVRPTLKSEGIDLIIVSSDDYNVPNRALADGEVDANFFQTVPFLQEQMRDFGYEFVSIARIEIEPMGLYSNKITSLSDLKDDDVIAIPNDPSNESRALLLLADHGLIQLENPDHLKSTPQDISENPRNLRFKEVNAAMLPRILSDVTAAAINTNFALEAGLSPEKDALIIESNRNSPYANVIVVRKGEQNKPDIIALKKAMTSEATKNFIIQKYKGSVIPAF